MQTIPFQAHFYGNRQLSFVAEGTYGETRVDGDSKLQAGVGMKWVRKGMGEGRRETKLECRSSFRLKSRPNPKTAWKMRSEKLHIIRIKENSPL